MYRNQIAMCYIIIIQRIFNDMEKCLFVKCIICSPKILEEGNCSPVVAGARKGPSPHWVRKAGREPWAELLPLTDRGAWQSHQTTQFPQFLLPPPASASAREL